MNPVDILLCHSHGDTDDISYDQWNVSHGIDNFVKTEFTCGGCFELTFVLHQLTGFPVWGIVDEHYYIINSDNKAVDIYGVRPTHEAPTKYNLNEPYSKEAVCIDMSFVVLDNDMVDWAKTIVAHFPEHFGITV